MMAPGALHAILDASLIPRDGMTMDFQTFAGERAIILAKYATSF